MSKTTPKSHCDWTLDNEGNWDTECGDKHILLEGGPRENQMRFCCYCGSPLRERIVRGDRP
jgi:hypothetical protein